MFNAFFSIKTIAEPNRLRILSLLRERELCVCELEGILGLSQPLVSAHLRVLRKLGLVRDRKDGKWVYFFLDPKAWKKEKNWLNPLITRISSQAIVGKDKSLLSSCLCDRVDGKCINRFRPSSS